MITVDATDMIGLLNVTERRDLFGLHALAKSNGVEAHDHRKAGGFDAHLDGILTGRDDRFREAVARDLMRHETYDGHPLIEEMACDLIAHAGLDPATLCAMALQLDGPISFLRDDAFLATVHAPEQDMFDAMCMATVHLGGGAEIRMREGKGSVTISDHPSTVIAGLARIPSGSSLREIVTHPVLDRHEIEISPFAVDTHKAMFEAKWTVRNIAVGVVLERRPKV